MYRNMGSGGGYWDAYLFILWKSNHHFCLCWFTNLQTTIFIVRVNHHRKGTTIFKMVVDFPGMYTYIILVFWLIVHIVSSRQGVGLYWVAFGFGFSKGSLKWWHISSLARFQYCQGKIKQCKHTRYARTSYKSGYNSAYCESADILCRWWDILKTIPFEIWYTQSP